jgi:hypothetical protein
MAWFMVFYATFDLSGVLQKFKIPINSGRGLCGHDHMVVGFTTTCAISAYQLLTL